MQLISFISLFSVATLSKSVQHDSIGEGVGPTESRKVWWDSLADTSQDKLSSLFETSWLQNQLDDDTRIAYLHTAQLVYDLLNSGKDSHPDDSYIGFAPLLLRASFHGAGTYTHESGTGGSNGGTIFNHAELADGQNGCIDTATSELFNIFHGSSLVPLADTMVISGVVALDFMEVSYSSLLRILQLTTLPTSFHAWTCL